MSSTVDIDICMLIYVNEYVLCVLIIGYVRDKILVIVIIT